jgi:hypothetical protein
LHTRQDNSGVPVHRMCDVLLDTGFRSLVLALALMLSGPVLAAGFTCAPATETDNRAALDELEEVVITGEESETDTKDLQAWLQLLVGRFTYEGYVDLCGKGNSKDQRAVTGSSDCIGSGSTPNVHCTVNVRWPAARGENGAPVLGGSSSLLPALVMFTQVDNKGVTEWASGMLVGDTFMSREPCVGIPGDCRKTTRVTARPGSNEISMLIDVRIDDERVLRQVFLLHRDVR